MQTYLAFFSSCTAHMSLLDCRTLSKNFIPFCLSFNGQQPSQAKLFEDRGEWYLSRVSYSIQVGLSPHSLTVCGSQESLANGRYH